MYFNRYAVYLSFSYVVDLKSSVCNSSVARALTTVDSIWHKKSRAQDLGLHSAIYLWMSRKTGSPGLCNRLLYLRLHFGLISYRCGCDQAVCTSLIVFAQCVGRPWSVRSQKTYGQGKPAVEATVLSFALKFKPDLFNPIAMSFY